MQYVCENDSNIHLNREVWKDAWCDEAPLNDSIPLDYAERRQLWFMCRGPRYSSELSRYRCHKTIIV